MYGNDVNIFLRKRYFVILFVSLGWILLYILRINLSIGIVEMTTNKSITVGNETFIREAQFHWSLFEEGIILSSFSWGYFLAPIGAFLSDKYGGVTTFGAGIVLTGLLTLLTPVLIEWNIYVYLLTRILEGAFEGISACCTSEILVMWVPPLERSRLAMLVPIGRYAGIMIGYPICGSVALYFNWRYVFYLSGLMAISWFVIWISLVRNSPANDKFILTAEKLYLMETNPFLSDKMKKQISAYPWRKILTSKAVLAYLNDSFVEAWSVSFLTYCLPLYIKDVYDVDIQDIGFISALPNISAIVGLVGGGLLADYLRNRKLMGITNIHKVYLTVAQISAVICLLGAAFFQSLLISMICFCLFRFSYTVSEISYEVLPLDMCGSYASFVNGLAKFSVSLGFTLNPMVMGQMISNHNATEWSRYFILLSLFSLWGGIIFYKFGSGDLQSWAKLEDCDKKEDRRPRMQT